MRGEGTLVFSHKGQNPHSLEPSGSQVESREAGGGEQVGTAPSPLLEGALVGPTRQKPLPGLVSGMWGSRTGSGTLPLSL